jgi:hypothetical protein
MFNGATTAKKAKFPARTSSTLVFCKLKQANVWLSASALRLAMLVMTGGHL